MTLFDHPAYRESLSRLPHWEALEGKVLLLSGASGMIGSFLTDALLSRNETLPAGRRTRILAVSRNRQAAEARFSHWLGRDELLLLQHDVALPFDALPAEPDYVIHAASTTHPVDYAAKPIETILTNVLGARNLLDVTATRPGSRFLLLSSVEIYGECREDTDQFSEDSCGYLNCNTLRAGYPEAKRVSEALLQAYREEKGVNAVILRLPRCYGPSMRKSDTKAIAQLIKNAIHGQDITLKSEGRQLFSYAHCCDAVRGILYVLLRGEDGQAYNLGDSQSNVTLRELAETAANIAGTRVIFSLPEEQERKGYSTASRALLDGSRLKALGWTPAYDIRTGLQETIRILRETET